MEINRMGAGMVGGAGAFPGSAMGGSTSVTVNNYYGMAGGANNVLGGSMGTGMAGNMRHMGGMTGGAMSNTLGGVMGGFNQQQLQFQPAMGQMYGGGMNGMYGGYGNSMGMGCYGSQSSMYGMGNMYGTGYGSCGSMVQNNYGNCYNFFGSMGMNQQQYMGYGQQMMPYGYGQQMYGQQYGGYGQQMMPYGNYGYGNYGYGTNASGYGMNQTNYGNTYNFYGTPSSSSSTSSTHESEPDHRTSPQAGTLSKDKNDIINYTTTGGWKVSVDGTTIKLTSKDGKDTTTIWGDPHVTEADGSKWDWTDDTATFMLSDGTKITMDAASAKGLVKTTSIYDKDQYIKINNEDKTSTSTVSHSKVKEEDKKEDDGTVYTTNNQGNDWTKKTSSK